MVSDMAVVTVMYGYPPDFGERYDSIPRDYTEADWDYWRRQESGAIYPHCNSAVLHAPGECAVCDLYPVRQSARLSGYVAFTGHEPLPSQQPCPADVQFPGRYGRVWRGNVTVG